MIVFFKSSLNDHDRFLSKSRQEPAEALSSPAAPFGGNRVSLSESDFGFSGLFIRPIRVNRRLDGGIFVSAGSSALVMVMGAIHLDFAGLDFLQQCEELSGSLTGLIACR
jgi:hypothetical protein